MIIAECYLKTTEYICRVLALDSGEGTPHRMSRDSFRRRDEDHGSSSGLLIASQNSFEREKDVRPTTCGESGRFGKITFMRPEDRWWQQELDREDI